MSTVRKNALCCILACAALAFAGGCGTDQGGGDDVATEGDAPADPAQEDAAPDPDAGDDPEDEDIEPSDAPDGEDAPEDAPVDGTVEVEWSVEVIDESPGFKSRVAAALDGDGALHLAYNVATDPEGWYVPSVWYATNAGGSWEKVEAAPADGISNEFPAIVVDEDGRPHLFYNRYNETQEQHDLFHVTTDAEGGFTSPQNLTGTEDADEYAADAASDVGGDIHLLFQTRTGDAETGYSYGVGYLSLSGGAASPVEEVAAEAATPALHPLYSIATDSLGRVHAAYCTPGDTELSGVLHYRARSGGSWGAEERLTETDLDIYSPSIDVDGDGEAHLAYVKGPALGDKTLHYNRTEGGSWAGEQALSTSLEDRSYYLGLAAEKTCGAVHIAFSRFYDGNGDILYLGGEAGSFEKEYRVTETPGMDEATPALAADPDGTVYIAFTENLSDAPHGTIYLAVRREVVVP